MIREDSRIYVAGHSGMVGSSLVRKLREMDFKNILYPDKRIDLTSQIDVNRYIKQTNPEYVFLVAARVGGILANNNLRGNFIYENLMIQSNVIHAAFESGVKKLIFLGSSCIYPRNCPQPMKEEYLLEGKLEKSNEPYALAKIAGIKMCESYFHQYGSNMISAMPTNLYGPHDNYDLQTSHVLPALMRKIHMAKYNSDDSVNVWGSGEPKREFMHVDDLADACIFVMKQLNAERLYSEGISHINIGTGKEITINQLALKLSEVIGFKGRFIFDRSKPDGTPQKLLDVKRMTELGWEYNIDIDDGIRSTYEWFKRNGME